MFDKNKKYGILGLARSGISAAEKIKKLGGKAFLSELRNASEVPEAEYLCSKFDCEFGGHTEKMFSCDEWIISPGIPLTSDIIEKGRERSIPMISELEFGYQIKSKDSYLIAVTGSNGKSTTASIIAHIIQNSGKNCILAGNIGNAFCSFPIEEDGIDYIVLEASSFQLDLIDTFKPDIAVLLNITPDHLDRYSSFKDYTLSKFNIFKNQNKTEHAVLFMDDEVIQGLEERIKAQRQYYSLLNTNQFRTTPQSWMNRCFIETTGDNLKFSIHDLQVKGPHNWANAMASVLTCRIAGLSNSEITHGLRTFKPLSHRLQFINTINGISFYNDSKATNPDSVRYALMSFEQPIRIIMGGSDKNEDFSLLTEILQKHAKKVYVTGATANKMRQAWFGKVPLTVINDFETCIRTAFEESMAGDNIVLSPACASFDRFRNFEHRGETFAQIVKKIAEENEKK